MNHRNTQHIIVSLVAAALLLAGCRSQAMETAAVTSATEVETVASAPTPAPPQVTLGYIGDYPNSLAALVSPETGLVIEVFDVAYSIDKGTLERYKMNVKPASGQEMLLEFYDLAHTQDGRVERDPGWHLSFALAEGQAWTAGLYEDVEGFPFHEPPHPGLSVSSEHTGCSKLTGRFEILELVRSASGQVERFAANFEQDCLYDPNRSLGGYIRFNTTVSP